MALPTTTLFGAMLVAGAATDLPLAAEKGATSNVVEVEGHRDFRQHFPEKPLGERVPVAVRTNLDFIPVPIVSLEALDHAQLMFEEALEREGAPFRYGVPRKLEVLRPTCGSTCPGPDLAGRGPPTDAENLMVKVENMSLEERSSNLSGNPETVNGLDPGAVEGRSRDLLDAHRGGGPRGHRVLRAGDAEDTRASFELTEVIHGTSPSSRTGWRARQGPATTRPPAIGLGRRG